MQEFYDGFESESLSEIWSHKKLVESAVELQNKIVRRGKQAVKITVHKGDCANEDQTTERDELLENKKFGPEEGKSYEYRFSFYLAEDFPIVDIRLIIAQWKQDNVNNSDIANPVLAIRYKNGKFQITLQTTEEKEKLFQTNEEIRGRWIDMVFQVQFSRENGFVKAYMDGVQIVDFSGITAYSEKYGYPKPGRFYFKMGLYRDTIEEPMTIYLDEFSKKEL